MLAGRSRKSYGSLYRAFNLRILLFYFIVLTSVTLFRGAILIKIYCNVPCMSLIRYSMSYSYFLERLKNTSKISSSGIKMTNVYFCLFFVGLSIISCLAGFPLFRPLVARALFLFNARSARVVVASVRIVVRHLDIRVASRRRGSHATLIKRFYQYRHHLTCFLFLYKY